MSRIRVLVVDDSAFARKVLRESLASSRELEVVGTASDGIDALEKIAALKPDVVTLDLVMPNLDGLGVLNALSAEQRRRVVIVSMAGADSDIAIAALATGAFELVRKPTALAIESLRGLADELVRNVIAAGRAILSPGYTQALAARLDAECAIEVLEAEEGLELRPGRAVIAQAGLHLSLTRRDTRVLAHLDARQSSSLHRPSVDVLFESAAESLGSRALGVVLTGMGDDGLKGARALVQSGAQVLTEAEASCVVYGMPRVVKEAGLSAGEAMLEDMATEIASRL